MELPRFEPMLATTQRPSRAGEWAIEPKLDGWRALVYVGEDGVVVRTRSARDVSASVPALQQLVQVGHEMVLDGELVADCGRASDFYRLGPRLWSRRQQPGGVSFAIFDVLYLDDVPLVDDSYEKRRARLEDLGLVGEDWCVVSSFAGDVRDVFGACQELGLEGAVAKKLDSPYQPGKRSRDWIKLKTTEWREVHAPLRHERDPSPAGS